MQCYFTREIFAFPNEHVYEVDEGELDEGREHGDETDDDEDVQRGGITNLMSLACLVSKTTRD